MTIAYYDPTVPQTVNVTAAITAGAPSPHPIMTGDLNDMVVSCDLSRRLYCYLNGSVAWVRDYPSSWPRGLDVYNGLIFAANGTSIDILHAQIGTVPLKNIPVPSAPAAINAIRISQWDGITWVTICFDLDGVGSVRLYRLNGATVCDYGLTLMHTSGHVARHPRDAVVELGWVFVADTFGHRVYAWDIGSGGMRDSTDVYYPNSVHVMTPAIIRICAEHENRIFDWDYTTNPDTRTLVYSAPVAPFNDITKTNADIVAAEAGTFDPASTFTPKKSLCATEAAGLNTLYSPNSARMKGDDMIVSDTDNGRVLVINSGVIVTEVVGFNNPVNAILL